MKQRILITGASGFIGSYLTEEALAQGYEVFAGIRKSSSKQFLQQEGLRLVELDFSSPSLLVAKLKDLQQAHGELDFIIHNAGITQASKLEDFNTVNFHYTQYLIEAVKASGMQLKKFVLISSLATYGPGDAGEMKPIEASDECRPVSAYGKSKLMASQYLAASGLPHLSIHPTGVYGPRDKGFFQFIKLLNRGLEPYVGRHQQKLSLIYVKDLAHAVISLLSTSAKGTYLLSDGEVYDKEAIGTEAKRILQQKTVKVRLPMRMVQLGVSCTDKIQQVLFNRLPFLNRQKLDEISSPNWLCNSDAVWKLLNKKPHYNLKSGIAETIHWYKENKWL